MARTNLHELANQLLTTLEQASDDAIFEGKLRQVSSEAGLNSVRSAEAIKLLEELNRIEVKQRGRRGRDTIIHIRSMEPVTLKDAQEALPGRNARKQRVTHDEVGKAVVQRLLELARDDALRSAQVDAFAQENGRYREKVSELEAALEEASRRENDLRLKLRSAEEALVRVEENLQRVFDGGGQGEPVPMTDDETKAVLDILRSGGS